MDFGLSSEQTQFRDALRGYLASRVPLERVRAVMESDGGFDDEIRSGLAEQGVAGVLVPEDCGGLGLGLLDAVVVAIELGRASTPVSFHSTSVIAPCLLRADKRGELSSFWLAEVAEGRATVGVALGGVTLDGAHVDGQLHSQPGAPAGAVVGGKLNGVAPFVSDAHAASVLLVLAGSEAGPQLYLVPPDAAGVAVTQLKGVDATRRLCEVRFDAVVMDDSMRLDIENPGATVARALDAGRVVIAADAFGAAERSLELAVEYSLTREQFGRIIGSYQAVKHMCAETFAELEPVRSLLWYAAHAWDQEADDSAYVAALLKSHAVETATDATSTCIQVYGGMGFTYECDMHLWFKRVGYDSQVLGSARALRADAAEIVFG